MSDRKPKQPTPQDKPHHNRDPGDHNTPGNDPNHTPSSPRPVRKMVSNDHVVLGTNQNVVLPPAGNEMIGKFRLHKKGFGFVMPDAPTEHGDLFVPLGNTSNALTGDHIRARILRDPYRSGSGKGTRSPYIGQVIEIIQRADKHYVGNLIQRGQQWVVAVDGNLLNDPVIIRDPHAKNAKPGDKVIIELVEYPEYGKSAEGVIVEILGESGQPDIETLAVMHAYGLAEPFPPEVVSGAREAAAQFDHKTIPPNRVDLTHHLICTIDPPDAKDFDDGISIDRLDPNDQEDGAAYELGVHIADVSHFVTQGSPLDQEAYTRGNSTYLPRKVIPMLPELLSNGVCSLQEGVNRFCKSVFIRYDTAGNVLGQRFVNAVIRSAKRLTYLEAQALIDGDLRAARKHTKSQPKYPSQLIESLKQIDELGRLLRKRRLKDGMIVLALPEVELVFNEQGFVIDAVPEDDAFTHTLIEMFMVEANEAAARVFDSLNVPLIRRTHPDPDANNLSDLRQFARVAGYNIPKQPTRVELQTLLNAARGKPAQYAVHLAVLKTLSKAVYSPRPIGHFALASEHYTHFTSPIRRYPDLTVHRALDAYIQTSSKITASGGKAKKKLRNQMIDDPRCLDEQTLIDLGRHCSTTERNAESAERDLRTFLVLELLSNYLGDDFPGTVTGVTSSGIYIQIDRYLVDGFIPVADLPSKHPRGDRWKLNRATGALVAQRSGKTITIGDRFVVRIASIKPASRIMELVIIESHPDSNKKRPPSPDTLGKTTKKPARTKRRNKKR